MKPEEEIFLMKLIGNKVRNVYTKPKPQKRTEANGFHCNESSPLFI